MVMQVCNVAPVPGETKVWQYITLMKRIFLIDCPGVVYNGAHICILPREGLSEAALWCSALRVRAVYEASFIIVSSVISCSIAIVRCARLLTWSRPTAEVDSGACGPGTSLLSWMCLTQCVQCCFSQFLQACIKMICVSTV